MDESSENNDNSIELLNDNNTKNIDRLINALNLMREEVKNNNMPILNGNSKKMMEQWLKLNNIKK